MTVTLYKAKLSLVLDLTAAGYDVVGSAGGIKVFNVDHIRYDGNTLIMIKQDKRTCETSSVVITKREFAYFDCV